ncbi:hypothetical protein DK150_400011 [Flavobacterium psychrophilum]|nr:hypothetical protein DK150_400011 [Flavobacterium psychrophilum]
MLKYRPYFTITYSILTHYTQPSFITNAVLSTYSSTSLLIVSDFKSSITTLFR